MAGVVPAIAGATNVAATRRKRKLKHDDAAGYSPSSSATCRFERAAV